MPAFTLVGADTASVGITTPGDAEAVLIPGEDPTNLQTENASPAVKISPRPAYLKINPVTVPVPPNVSAPVEVSPGVFDFPDIYIRRRSQVWPAAVLDSHGRPTNWEEPTSEVKGNWARLQILIDNTDYTFYRDIPTVIEGWGSSEPFDDDTCTLFFPQVTSLESVRPFLTSEHPVEIVALSPIEELPFILWEGFIGSFSDSTDEGGYGIRAECYGALYDGDRYLKHPALHPQEPYDVGTLIWQALGQTPPLRTAPHIKVVTGIRSNDRGGWNPLVTGYIADLLATASTEDGDQWTLMKDEGRIPVLRLKDKTTVHWTVTTGTPGISHNLTRDWTMSHNVYYGEGVTEDNCRWRNAIYPQMNPDDAPVWDGTIYNPGVDYDETFRIFKNKLISKGFHVSDDTTYYASEEGEIRRLQASYGGLVTGIVAGQTWAGTFSPGANGGDLRGGIFYPLAFTPETLVRLYNGNGVDKVENPVYDPAVIRRERYINFGTGVSLPDATQSSKDLHGRFYPADFIGDITLKSDPEEGHRFLIKAGQSILLKEHFGSDRLFHIARADIDPLDGSASLEVDEAGRDALTLAEIKQRNKENSKASWRQDKKYRNSRATEDRTAVWDCENGSGVIPRHGTFRRLWNVLTIPCAAGGTVVRTEFTLDTPSRFSVGIFDRPITHTTLASRGSPVDEGYWDDFGDELGLLIAWGGAGQMAGYYPGSESDEDAKTGRLVDDSSWYFESTRPPWLWVAIWVEEPTVNYCSGRLYPGSF